MRILFLSNMYPSQADPVGGIFVRKEILSIQQCDEIDDIKVVVPVLRTLPFSKKEKAARSPLADSTFTEKLHYISAPSWRFPWIAGTSIGVQFQRIIDTYNPDIIHIHTVFPCSLALLHIKKPDCPVVITTHGSDWYKAIKREPTKRELIKAMKKADRIFAVGDKLRSDIVVACPELESKIRVRHHGIDGDAFPLVTDRKKWKEKAGLNTDQPVILCVANRNAEKGIDVLLEAVSLSENLKKARVIIIGKKGTDVYERDLQSIIKTQGLHEIRFVDALKPDALFPWYAAADVYVQPSRSEGFGIAILEAASTGCPIVATRSGGPEQTVSEAMGVLVESENPAKLMQALENVLLTQKYPPKKIRASVLERFGAEKAVRELMDEYGELVI